MNLFEIWFTDQALTRHRSALLSIADMSSQGLLVHDFGMLFFVLKMLVVENLFIHYFTGALIVI